MTLIIVHFELDCEIGNFFLSILQHFQKKVLKHFHFSPYKLFATFENFPFRWKILKCNLVCHALTQIHINVLQSNTNANLF